MKFSLVFALISLITLSGCDSIRKLVGNAGKKTPAPAAASANLGPLVLDIPDGGFDTFTHQGHRLVIVVFGADWSAPSSRLLPLWDKLTAEKQGVVVVGKVKLDHFRHLAALEGVKDIPDVRMYRDGRLVEKFVGPRDEKEIRKMVETHAKGLSPAALVPLTTPHSTTQPMTKDWKPSGLRVRRQ